MPEAVEIPETPFEEKQEMLREIDEQRKKEDPNFKGAFHEKKNKKVVISKSQKKPATPTKKKYSKRKK
jgi:ATP-dependent RNA helicase RhlE